jgi:hypothetical protein
MSLIIWRIERDRKGDINSSFIIKQTKIKTLYVNNKTKTLGKMFNRPRKRYLEKRANINPHTLLSIYYMNDDQILVIKIKGTN